MSMTTGSPERSDKKVLNAGAGPRSPRRLHPIFTDGAWHEVALDIDPTTEPDQIGSVTDMRAFFPDASFDAVWSSHNIEHLYAHEVPIALREFRRVLKRDGFALITCPDLEAAAEHLLRHGLDHKVYDSPAGPIVVHDMIFGHGASIEAGNTFMAHNCGFTADGLGDAALRAGFAEAHVGKGSAFDLWAVFLMPDADRSALSALLERSYASFLLPAQASGPPVDA